MRSARFLRAIAVTTLAVIVIDQIAKAIVVREIALGSGVPVVEGVFRLVHVRNSGIAGGMLAGESVGLIVAVSALALCGLTVVALSLGPRPGLWLPVGMILGGGLGNLLDRVRSGAVTDFLVVGHHGPANLADLSITLGIVGMLVIAWRTERTPRPAVEPT